MSDWKTRPWDGSPVPYPDPAIEILDTRFEKYAIGNAAVERLCTGLRWGRRPGVVWRRALCALQRHSQQSHHALERDRWQPQRLSPTVQLLQWFIPATEQVG